jgi:hypothetical protein
MTTKRKLSPRARLKAAVEKAYQEGREAARNDSRCNGWSNYETWNVNKYWKDRSEYWWDQAQYSAQVGQGTWTREEGAIFHLADELKEHFEAEKDELLDAGKMACTMWSDLLGAALSEVDWQEIAKHMIEDVDKE